MEEQLSVVVGSVQLTTAPQAPLSLSTVISPGIETMVGSILSSTVTTAEQKPIRPFASVTNRVTVFGPISSQSKELDGETAKVIELQSVDPPSKSLAFIVTAPVASN